MSTVTHANSAASFQRRAELDRQVISCSTDAVRIPRYTPIDVARSVAFQGIRQYAAQ